MTLLCAACVKKPAVAPAVSAPAPPDFASPDFDEPLDEPYEPGDPLPDEYALDEPSPDDRTVRDAELTGMELIQRELGGQVIGEIEG